MKIFASNIFKKLLAMPVGTQKLPMHAGEIYYLWEGLTSGYKLIEMAETYLMNTEDATLQLYLKGLTTGTFLLKIKRLEQVLKNEGFNVPPRPASKLRQGYPGVMLEVTLSDKDVIKNIVALGEIFVVFNARAIMASTKTSVRNLFKDLMGEHIKSYKIFLDLGKNRNLINPPPPMTGRKGSMNIGEAYVIWDELNLRYVSQVNMETYLASTRDKELQELIQWGLKTIVFPQMQRLEDALIGEGITIPPRPSVRTEQHVKGMVSKIRASDDETIGVLTLAFQAAIIMHVKALMAVLRDDLYQMFEGFLYKEFEGYDKLMTLAKNRKALKNPPIVSSRPI